MPLSGNLLHQIAARLIEISMVGVAGQQRNTMFVESISATVRRLYQQRDTFAFHSRRPVGQDSSDAEAWFRSQFHFQQITLSRISLSGDVTHLPMSLTQQQPQPQHFRLVTG
jgi:hypothetical protein